MNHEGLRVYQATLELVSICSDIIERLPPGLGFLADQLRRASASVALNLAEGCKKPSPKERARYLDIASGSAREVSAILDVAARFHGIGEDTRVAAKDKCDHICAMLFRFR